MKLAKGIMIFLVSGILGCGKETVSLNKMKIEQNGHGSEPYITWQPIESEQARYEVVIQAVNGTDGGNAAELVSTETTTSSSYNGMRQIAWYAQEHHYYGWMRYQVTAYEGDKAVSQGISDPFLVSDYYPEEEELSWSPEEIIGLNYWGSGDSIDLIFNYSLYKEGNQVLFEAEYSDNDERISIDTAVSEEVFEQLKLFLKGTIRKKHADDPDIVILDGSEEQFTLRWEHQSEKERTWYEFIPEQKQALVQWLKSIGRSSEDRQEKTN